MSYSVAADVRDKILNVTTEDAPDKLLNTYIEQADEAILRDLTTRVRNETLSGSMDGINCTFTIDNFPIADINFDKAVTTADVSVYGWTISGNEASKTALTVSSLIPESGIIYLATAPDSNTHKGLTIDYSYYQNEIDWTLIEMASQIYAGYLYAAREVSLLPARYQMGSLRIEYEPTRGVKLPHDRLLERYKEIIGKIRSKPYERVEMRETLRPARRELRSYVP